MDRIGTTIIQVLLLSVVVGFAAVFIGDVWTARRRRCWCGRHHDCPHR